MPVAPRADHSWEGAACQGAEGWHRPTLARRNGKDDCRLLLAESHLTRPLFGTMVRRIEALPALAGWSRVAVEKSGVKQRQGRGVRALPLRVRDAVCRLPAGPAQRPSSGKCRGPGLFELAPARCRGWHATDDQETPKGESWLSSIGVASARIFADQTVARGSQPLDRLRNPVSGGARRILRIAQSA